jgi:RHS repeat-associated protein
MNQDTVANLYDFPAREYGIQGRWPSPDPAGLYSVRLIDPQSLNRYAYIANNPLSFIDSLGLNIVDAGGGCTWDTDDNTLWCPLGGVGGGGGGGLLPVTVVFGDSGGIGGGSGGGVGGILGWWNSFKSVNQCAGSLSQSFSLNAWPGNFWSDAFLGNEWGTIAQAALGPDQGAAAAQLMIDNPTQKASLNGVVQTGVSALPTGGTTTTIATPISYMPSTYNPVTAAQTANTVGSSTVGQAVGAGLTTVIAAKAVFDAGVYIGALGVCASQ